MRFNKLGIRQFGSYNYVVAKIRNLPDADRLSILVGMILFTYAVAHFIELPENTLTVEFAGILIPLRANINNVIALLTAGMTAAGTDWLLRDHPVGQGQAVSSHWVLPGLTAWIISLPLGNLPITPLWWVAFTTGGGFLILVIIAEYIAVDPQDIRYPIASAGLTGLSFVLFLILATTLRALGFRLIWELPAIALTAGLLCLRALHLRQQDSWQVPQSIAVTLIAAQTAVALHYLPFSPMIFGLVLLGMVYASTNFMLNIGEGKTATQAFAGPLVILVILLIMAFFMR